MSSVSVFCCLKSCLDGFKFQSSMPYLPKESPIRMDTAYMGKSKICEIFYDICIYLGYEVVIVKGGLRVCGAGTALGNAPLIQSKSYFEVKVQQGGVWSIALATRQTDLSLTQGNHPNT